MLFQIFKTLNRNYSRSIFITANCETIEKPKNKVDEFLNIRDELLKDDETKVDYEVNITEEILDEKFSKLTFIESYKLLLERNSNNELTQEGMIFQFYPFYGGMALTLIWALAYTPEVSREFKLRHLSTAWPTPYLAKRKYLDNLISRSVVRGAKKSIPVIIMSTGLMYIPLITEIYLKRTVFWDFGLAGMLIGSLYCFFRGPAAMLTGGLLMGIPTFFLGIFHSSLRHWTNSTIDIRIKERLKEEMLIERQIFEQSKKMFESV